MRTDLLNRAPWNSSSEQTDLSISSKEQGVRYVLLFLDVSLQQNLCRSESISWILRFPKYRLKLRSKNDYKDICVVHSMSRIVRDSTSNPSTTSSRNEQPKPQVKCYPKFTMSSSARLYTTFFSKYVLLNNKPTTPWPPVTAVPTERVKRPTVERDQESHEQDVGDEGDDSLWYREFCAGRS